MNVEIDRDMLDPEAMILTGLDDCVIGCDQNMWLIYDYDKLVKHFCDKDGMTQEEAVDYVGYNIVGLCPRRFVIFFEGTFINEQDSDTRRGDSGLSQEV